MHEQLRGRAGVIPILILVMLATLALSQSIARYPETIGVDFYQFWGVPVALRITGHTLGTPYTDGERYHSVLREYAASASQPKLRLAHRFWSGPDFAGSPLLYRVFSLVSSDYTFALGVFRTLQLLAFLGACVLLGYLYRVDAFYLLSFALICLLFYQPLLSDLRVANLGSLQLAALAALMGLASALPGVASFAARAALGAVLLVALAALTLCKPNIVLVSAFLALHLAVRHGARLFALAALPAALATAVFIVVPCLYFNSWTVWQEWYRFVYGANPRMLVRPIASGNYSTPLLLSTWLGGSVSLIAGVLLVLLVASLAGVIGARASGPAAPRTPLGSVRAALDRLFADPRAALALGILLTTATSPLYWAHYYVLLLIPSLWLLNATSAPVAVPALAAASVVMSAGIAGMLLWGAGWASAMPPTIALSWVPLWGALLIERRSAGADAPRGAAGAGPGPATAEPAPPPRSRRRRK